MINTSETIYWLKPQGLERAKAVTKEVSRLCKDKAGYNGKPFNYIQNRQLRRVLALPILGDTIQFDALTPNDFDCFYTLTLGSTDDRSSLVEGYRKLTGNDPSYIDDVIGLRTSLRAIFAVLWSEGLVTLPHTFRLDGVHARFPELTEKTQGFLYDLTKHDNTLLRASRSYQYRTDWHSYTDIKFSDLWQSTPQVIDTKKKSNGITTEFSYLPTIKHISKIRPDIISPDESFHLEKYLNYLQAKPRSESAAENQLNYTTFKRIWGADSENWEEMSKKEREHFRHKNRIEHLKIEPEQKNLGEKKASTLEKISADIEAGVEPDRIALSIRQLVKRRYEDFSWLKNGFYPLISAKDADIDSLANHWKAAVKLYYDYLDNVKTFGKKSRNTQLRNVAFLMDYLFCYLPLWRNANPETLIEIPYLLSEFQRIIFWNNEFVSDEYSLDFHQKRQNTEKEMPLTLLQFYQKKYSKKTASGFIKTIFDFFEVAITAGRRLIIDGTQFNDGNLTNPVNQKLDSPGSGSRGKSDKIVLPLSAVPVAEAYLLALDHIGQKIQEGALTNKISRLTLESIRSDEWIDLKELKIEYDLELRDPNTGEVRESIRLDKITNAYNWHLGRYDTNKRKVWMPWLSANRMLMIALYGGLRMQNCQWLDIRTFDRYYSAESSVLGYTTLFVNTDKNGSSRPVTLEEPVFNCLLNERRFQNSWLQRPVVPVRYEDDKNDKRYGEIYPLFRSPYSKKGLPFSDQAYFGKWVEILKGIQSIYNQLVPENRKHVFVEINENGNLVAVHTPHSLRATWITYKTIYGHLALSLTGKQVGHANPKTTLYYNVPSQQEIMEQVKLANQKASVASWSDLWGQGNHASNVGALQEDLRIDYKEAISTHGLISVGNSFVDATKNGLDLIPVTNITKIAWNSTCACTLDGHCPSELLSFTKTPKVCGLCPYSVFGVVHLPAINAKMRFLIASCENFKDRIDNVAGKRAPFGDVQHLHQQLTVHKLELAGYEQIRQILNKNLESNTFKDKYISRNGNLRQAGKEIDYSDNAQRLIANIIDGKLYPAFASDNYILRLKKLAASPKLLEIALAEPEEKEEMANQIIFMLSNSDISFAELGRRIEHAGRLGIAQVA